MTVSISGTDGVTFNDNSVQTTAAKVGMVNRIINGAMVIDQRNAGASVTPTTNQYLVDRWQAVLSQASKYTAQQSSTAPTGFVNSLKITSSSAYSLLAGDFFQIQSRIEGYNISDLGFGTASAATVTLSFWVQSSLTGTFGLFLVNDAGNRLYGTSYTINAANTWEQKTITITGDTSGTWATTNSTGIRIAWSLGYGSTYTGVTPNVWGNSGLFVPSGCVNVLGTNGATFFITGVQLEKGSTATSFDYRPYGTEFNLCQRYFYKPTFNEECYIGVCYSTTQLNCPIGFPVTMRSAPTITLATAGQSSTNISFLGVTAGYPAVTGSHTAASITVNGFRLAASGYTATGWAAGVGTWLYVTGTSAPFSASAEL